MRLLRSKVPGESAKNVARRFASFVRGVIGYASSEMEYVPQGWYRIEGWNDPGIVDAQERHWPTLVRSLNDSGPLGISHLPWHTTREDLTDHNIVMSYGYVLAVAAGKRTRLSLLDWGGGVGHYYLYTKALFPELEIEYHCFDIPKMIALGKKLLPQATMHDDEQSCLGRRYDIVISSSSLHYFEDWRAELRKLVAATGEFLYVARLQAITQEPSFVVLHRPGRSGYPPFLSWCINRQEFLTCVDEYGMTLVREFIFTSPWTIRKAPEKGHCRGFLLRRRHAAS